jgi:hypothetical protein
MSNLDDELRLALTREEPPEGFAERVLARLPREASNVVEMRPRRRMAPAWLAAAAALVLVALSAWAMLTRPESAPEPVSIARDVEAPAPSTGPLPSETKPEEGEKPPVTEAPTGKHGPRIEIATERRRRAPSRKPRFETVAHREPAIDEAEWRAAEQFMLAMSITNEKIKTVRRNVLDTRAVPET